MDNPLKRPDISSTFLPEDYVARKSEWRASLLAGALFIVVMGCVGAAFLVTNQRWESVRNEQALVSEEFEAERVKIEQLKRLEEQRSSMLEKAEITTALIERVPRSVLLAELVTRMPDDVTLLDIELSSRRIQATTGSSGQRGSAVRSLSGNVRVSDENKEEERPRVVAPRFEYTLVIQGVASRNNKIADYERSLRASPLLRAVDLRYIQPTQIDGSLLRRFEITARLRDDADAHQVALAREAKLKPFGEDPDDQPYVSVEPDLGPED